MSNKQNAFERNTAMAKPNHDGSNRTALAVYLVIWLIAILYFWIFMDHGDALGYGLVVFWFLLPVTTLILSVWIGKRGSWGKYRWVSAIFFGVMYMLADYMTFCLANMLANQRFRMPMFELFFIGAIISLIGLAIGAAVHAVQSKRGK